MLVFLIPLAILGGLTLWYGIGLLGSSIGLAALDDIDNDWEFGRRMALGGPINLFASISFAVVKSFN